MPADAREVRIYGDIGEWAVTATSVSRQLDRITADTLDVRINSHGGDVWDGFAIHNALRRHRARVTVHVDGVAASAASFIAMAGDDIVIAPNARMMIHEAWMAAVGNAAELGAAATILDGLSATIAELYAARAGGTPAQWRDVMRAERWYTAAEALQAGLVDRIADHAAARPAAYASGPGIAPADRTRAIAIARARRIRNTRSTV